MNDEFPIDNTPPERRKLSDTANLRLGKLLRKEDSKVYDPHELSDKSMPEMFYEDWEPMIHENALSAKSEIELAHEKAITERDEREKLLIEDDRKAKQFLMNVFIFIGVFLVICFIVVVVASCH